LFEFAMAKLELPDHQRRLPRVPRALVLGVVLGGLAWAQAAQALGEAGRRSFGVSARPPAGWRMVRSSRDRAPALAVLAAAQTWSVHKPRGRQALAALTVRCAPDGTLGLYVSFPDRIWPGDAFVAYRLGRGRPRPVRPLQGQPSDGAEWLGGSDLVRQLARADVLEVLIDDIGLGASEAVFHLAGAKTAVQRVEEDCADERVARPATPGTPPGKAMPARAARQEGKAKQLPNADRQGRQEPAAPALIETPEQRSPRPDPSKRETPDVSIPLAPPPLPQGEEVTPPPSPSGEPHAAAPSPAAEAPAAAPLPQPAEPKPADQNARLAAFLQTYGRNRKGELIYDWYRQCLDRAGLEVEQVWYLSQEELTYLSRGDPDRVRLSMLISTSSDFDVPPRRITCYGTARGRELTIERAE
jgi:hypothetical protein